LLELDGKLFCLLVGKLQLAVQDQSQLAGAGILKLGFQEGGGVLSDGRKCGLEVCGRCHGREERRGDLLTHGVAQRAGKKRLTEQAIGIDAAEFGGKMQAPGCAIRFDPVLFCSSLFCSILFCSILVCSIEGVSLTSTVPSLEASSMGLPPGQIQRSKCRRTTTRLAGSRGVSEAC
jgi:hypothetical protein